MLDGTLVRVSAAENRLSALNALKSWISLVFLVATYFCAAVWVQASLGCEDRCCCGNLDAMTEQVQHRCKTCNLMYDESGGRLHGSFVCHTCLAADKALRRNLGDRTEIQAFSKEETYTFFRKAREAKEESVGKRLDWPTLRATLIHHVTQRQVTEFRSGVETAALPLSVYLAQGWEESVVKNCPSVFNEALGVQTYKVPVQRETWTETFQRVQERILTQEKTASLRKKKKGAEKDSANELDLPAEPKKQATTKGDNSEKKAAVEQRKLCAANVKVSGQAAKALHGASDQRPDSTGPHGGTGGQSAGGNAGGAPHRHNRRAPEVGNLVTSSQECCEWV